MIKTASLLLMIIFQLRVGKFQSNGQLLKQYSSRSSRQPPMYGAMEFCSGKSWHLEKDLTGIGQISRYVKTNIHATL